MGKIVGVKNASLLTLLLISFLVLTGGQLLAQSFEKVPAKRANDFSPGIEATQVIAGTKIVAFVKSPGKRTLYAEGSFLQIRLSRGKQKVQGYINRINDTAVMINGINCKYENIDAYYVPMPLCKIFGSALCIAGGGYILLDGINGAINKKDPVFNVEALAAGIPMAVAGGTILAFMKVKRSTNKWKIKVMNW